MNLIRWAAALATIIILSPPIVAQQAWAASSCGLWDHIDQSPGDFAKEPFGTLAILNKGSYFVLGKGRCVELREKSKALHFVVNHNQASSQVQTFFAAQVSLISIKPIPDSQYLYRNGSKSWDRDKTGIGFNKSRNDKHEDFNGYLTAGQQPPFDERYARDGRYWNDSVSATIKQSTWDSRDTFVVRDEILGATKRKDIGLKTQNYLIGFTSRTGSADLGSVPDFDAEAEAYNCVIVQLSGTSAFDLDGRYMITFKESPACRELANGFAAGGGDFNSASVLSVFP